MKDENVVGGAARIRGTRIRVMDIVEEYEILDRSPEEIAAVFDLSLGDVFQALSYYYDNREGVKAEIRRQKRVNETV